MKRDICVLHAALQCSAFTVDQLTALTGLKKATIEGSLVRIGQFIEEVRSRSEAGRGHPMLFRVRESARAELTRRSAMLSRDVAKQTDEGLDDVTGRVTVALSAAESAFALSRDPAAAESESMRWQRSARQQLGLARELLKFVEDAAKRAELAPRFNQIAREIRAPAGAAPLETHRRVSASAVRVGVRIIKKYPNRRLYDPVESRHITLADIRKLAADRIDFVVVDKKEQTDITRSVLLQVIAEQEEAHEPVMSRDFLSLIIRTYGGPLHGMVGSYLEQSVKLFMAQQREVRERGGHFAGDVDAMAVMANRNYQRWRAVQDEIYSTLVRAAGTSAGASDEEDWVRQLVKD